MRSELVKKLDAELIRYKRQFLGDVAYGIDMARQIVREHEAQQMKEPFYRDIMLGYIDIKIKLMTASKSPMDEHDKGMLKQLVMMKNWLTKWAIEQEKLEEEK